MTSQFYVGKRLSFSSATCTVRYYGPVHGTNGEWLGVEWDDPDRGKHDGEHGGVRYFTCQSQCSTAASFVRPNRPRDEPLGFLDALRQKYASDVPFSDAGSRGGNALSLHASETPATSAAAAAYQPIEWGGKVVEEVGFEKVRRRQAMLPELRIILLDGCRVAGLTSDAQALGGDDDGASLQRRTAAMQEIARVCPNVVELDLSRNLIERWQDVVAMCAQLRALRSLRVNGNRFLSLACPRDGATGDPYQVFRDIQELGLDENLLTWDDICDISRPFASLSFLSASFNQLSSLDRRLDLQGVSKIMLEYNRFSSLAAVSVLADVPSLKSLCLGHNRIATVGQPRGTTSDNAAMSLRFHSRLTYVDLSHNAIDDWAFIDQLQQVFPGLTGLRVSHNPLYDGGSGRAAMGVEDSYMLTLSRLENLKTLNFSQISLHDRAMAEMYYLSCIAREIEAAASVEEDEAAILGRHPRYAQLCALHGPPVIKRRRALDTDPNSLEARLVIFTFVRPAASSSSTPSVVTPSMTGNVSSAANSAAAMKTSKRLPRSFDTYRLKAIVGRLFGLAPAHTRLVLETDEWDPVERDEDDSNDSDDDDYDDYNDVDADVDVDIDGATNGGNEEKNNVSNNSCAGEQREKQTQVALLSPGSSTPAEQEENRRTTRRGRRKEKWKRREIELVDGTREVGFWVEGEEARVRVETC